MGARFSGVCALLLSLAALQPAAATVDYDALRQLAPEARLRQTIGFFSGLGSRVAGYPGAEQAALHVHRQFRHIDLHNITFHKYDVSVPMDRGGSLDIAGGPSMRLHGLWPNLVRTSTLPDGGIDGRLIWGGKGEFEDLDGQDIAGSVVVLDFNSGDNWLNTAYLGAAAVVFVEPDSTVYLEGERKFLTMPLDMPRFWVGEADGRALRQAIERNDGVAQAHLEYRMDWERQPAWNVMGMIPGYDPLLKDDVIVIESYYDAMSVVPSLAPGAEQAAGITALLELAHYFRQHPPARSVLFLATSAHHLALRGVDDFIQRYLRDEDPFIDRMVVRRVVEAALARGLIEEAPNGISYRLGNQVFTGKEALIRQVSETDTVLVRSIIESTLRADEQIIAQGEAGWNVRYRDGEETSQKTFTSRELLESELADDEDLRLGFYREWVDPKVDSLAVKLFISLDLSTQTDELGIWNSNSSFYYKRYFAPFGKNFMGYSRQVSRELGYTFRDVLVNGISPEGGKSWETFVPGEISVNSELVLTTGTPALAFVTVNDARFLVDTPLDRPQSVRYDNLARQIKALAGMFHMAFEDPELFPDFKMRLKDTLRSLKAKAMVFPRRSIVPDLPREGAVGVVRNGKKKSYKGVRGEYFELVDDSGAFYVNRIRVNSVQVEGYYADPATGRITYAPDRGIQGDKAYPMKIAMDWRDKEWMVVLFPSQAFNFFDIVDPRYLTKLSQVTIFDETNTAPVEYGYTIGEGPSAQDEPVGVLFARPGSLVKMGFGAGLLGFRSLLLNSDTPDTKEEALGDGYAIEDETSFARTSYLAARDMWTLDESRMRELASFAITNERLNSLHERAKVELDLGEAAYDRKEWSQFVRHTRSAIGLESRAYPDVKDTQNDVVQGIIFFMALVLPCAYFAERLLITAATIQRQIMGFAAIFLVIWVILSIVHPAFELSNPFVILLAFVILVLAILVMWIIMGRFNEQMKKLRTEVAVIYDTDVSRSSASMTAFLLGISNMKRRKLRTVLTFLTLLLLTFTVLSFTSIQTALRFNQIERDNEGLYEGLLIRSKAWTPLEESVLDYAYSNFGDRASIAPRSWYDNKKKAHIKMKYGDNAHNALGVLGLTPEETEVTGLDRALMAGRWFRPGEEKVVILPSEMIAVAALNIDIDDVNRGDGSVKIRVFGEQYTVIGIINSKRMKELKDLDDETMTPADFAVTGGQAVQEIAEEESREKQGLEDSKVVIKPFVHLEPANTLLMPYHSLRNVGSGNPLQSVGIRFHEDVDERAEIETFLSRLAVTLFAGIQEPGDDYVKVSIYSSLGMTSLSGMANLFVPILIAALIVLNTMMGSVYERFREIGVYSSVGLAPGHIAWLFMAESCVYAVLGVVAGYLVGQIMATALTQFDVATGFTLNYSSLSAVLSCILVMAVVMLSTVYPSRKASEMAVPDVTRRWRLPSPEGDEWHFEFPFTVGGRDVLGLSVFLIGYFDSYSEESIGTFYTDGAKLGRADAEFGEAYTIDMNIWLAPFDLGVSQHVTIRAIPEAEHNIFQIQLDIQRLSGEDASWRRVNQRFMNVIRKQFLIWRTVDAEAKEAYRKEAQAVLDQMSADNAQRTPAGVS